MKFFNITNIEELESYDSAEGFAEFLVGKDAFTTVSSNFGNL